jgi:hypothetical protein
MVDDPNTDSSSLNPTDTCQPTSGKTAKREYEVGYGKPPKKSQFKKGQSGNPKGSKKTERIDDLLVVIEGVLAEPVTIRDGGKTRTVSKLEAMFHAQRLNALRGDPKAFRRIVKLAQTTGQFSRATPRSNIVLEDSGDEDQKKMLRMFEAEQQALKRSGHGTGA